jgi:tripartite-type tricarboxylate transporter receptor subunit TctC
LAAAGDDYPKRPIRLVVPFSAGGGSDLVARVLAQKYFEAMGQQVIVDNRPGGGGTIGVDIVAHAPADGYTLVFTTATLAVNVSLRPKAPFNVLRDLAPVSHVLSVPLVLVVQPSMPVRTVNELAVYAKAKNGALNYASNGAGSTSHLAAELFKNLTGTQMTHIPYKGGGDSLTALMANEVQLEFNTVVSAQPQVRAGKIRALAVTTANPSRVLPDVPTMAASMPGFEIDNWYGMLVPAGTPPKVIARLNTELVRALKRPEVNDLLLREGAEPVGSTPEQFGTFLKNEIAKYAALIKQSGAKAE